MSETLKQFPSQSKPKAVKVADERPVVLSFPRESIPGNGAASIGEMSKNGHDRTSAIPLIRSLCEALNCEEISYCHWKSNWRLSDWLMGDGDLDLLVKRADAHRFVSLISDLGFKQAEPPVDRQVPGILNFYGYDQEAKRFVHLHVHYQLVIGHDLTKNYHLPIEHLFLEHTVQRGPIPVPAPEFELILFVFRMVLKHSTVETMLRQGFGRSGSKSAVELELEDLESKTNRGSLDALLPRLIPEVDNALFYACLESLRSGSSLRRRTMVRKALQTCLATYARRPAAADALVKAGRRITRLISERVLRRRARKRFVNGGLLIAIVGGDGAGKTTALKALDKWLSKKFMTQKFHVGKPPRSVLTLGTIVVMRICRFINPASRTAIRFDHNGAGIFPGYLRMFRWVRAGKDRRRLYTRARRFATNGGIAICDRYPLERLRLMDGPNIARTVAPSSRNALTRRMLDAEMDCYRSMAPPDLLFVLRVDPEIAVRRKTNESEHHVRQRSRELWEQDWQSSNAYVIDAGLPAEDVVAQLKSIIWAKL